MKDAFKRENQHQNCISSSHSRSDKERNLGQIHDGCA